MICLSEEFSYEKICFIIREMKKEYPKDLCTEVIGLSHDNREIIGMQVGKGKKVVLLTAGVHGREIANPPVLLRMMEYYLQNRERLVFFDQYSIAMIPLVNPDGYTIATKGFQQIQDEGLRAECKVRRIPETEWKANARGIDLNRNFISKTWSSRSGTTEPGSERETQAVMNYMKELSLYAYMDYHSRGECIYYYRNQMDILYNKKQKMYAKHLEKLTGYQLVSPEEEIEEGDIGGNSVHYASEAFGVPAISMETLPEDTPFPLKASLNPKVMERIYLTPFVFQY